MRLLEDLSFSAIVAGLVAVLVAFTGSAVIVLQAADALGASPAETTSWILSLGVATGVTSIALSLRFRVPVLTAWSTPGAAMLVTGVAGISMPEAIGAFMVCAALIVAVGATGWFEKLMAKIPHTLGSAMLAGILLRFGLDAFSSMQTRPVLVISMFATYLLMRRLSPRYAVPAVLLVGTAIAGAQGMLGLEGLSLHLARPVFTMPEFSVAAVVGVALPLFIVTMASQNMPGVAILRASGYEPPLSPLITWTGITSFVLAPFGAFSLNLAAITAAITMGRDAHEDPDKRYVAAVAAGVFYLIVGLFGATIVSMFALLPRELVVALAGLALLGTIGTGLSTAMHDADHREPALVTFLVTASGLTLLGIGAAFWGIVAGLLATAVLLRRRDPQKEYSGEIELPAE